MENGESSMALDAGIDLSNLIDYELTFEFRKLTKVLASMLGVVNDVRNEQTRTRADIELLFSHIKLIQSKPGFSDDFEPGGIPSGPARIEKVVDDGLLERIANVENRLRTTEVKLAQITSVQETNKAKKLARDVESTMMRVQVLERVTSTAFANSVLKLSPEELKKSCEDDLQARKLLDEPDDSDLHDLADKDSSDEPSTKPKLRPAEKPSRNGNDGTGGVDTFLALAKMEKVESLVARMKAAQQEFQIRINQENHDRSREFHELKDLMQEAMQRAEQISVQVERNELQASKELLKQAEAAALVALKQWQQEQINDEQSRAEQRFHVVQMQVRQLQNVLDEQTDINPVQESLSAPTPIDQAHLDALRDSIKKVQAQSAASAANLTREVSILIQRVTSIQKAIDDVISNDEQLELEQKTVNLSTRKHSVHESDASGKTIDDAHANWLFDDKPDQVLELSDKASEPNFELHSNSSSITADTAPAASFSSLRDDVQQLHQSDQVTKKVLVQFRLALQQMKDRLNKQTGEMARLSSFVYGQGHRQPGASSETALSASPPTRLWASPDRRASTRVANESQDLLGFPREATNTNGSLQQTQLSTESSKAPLSDDITNRGGVTAAVGGSDENRYDVEDPEERFFHRRRRPQDQPAVDVDEAQAILAEVRRWAQVVNQELVGIRQDIACKPDVDSVMALFSIWKEMTTLPGAESPGDDLSQAAVGGPSAHQADLSILAGKLLKDLATKADRSDILRLETRYSLIADDLQRLATGNGFDSMLADDRADMTSPELDSAPTDTGNSSDNHRDSSAMGLSSHANSSQQNWAAVRVFTKMQDRASAAALNKRIALVVQDVKRLSKTTGEIEEDIDTMRGLTMGIRKKISELESLHSSSDSSEDAIKDKTFIRTLRARIQLISTELERKADRSELDGKADLADVTRIASQIQALRRAASIDRDLPDAVDTIEDANAHPTRLATGKLSRNAMNFTKRKSIRGGNVSPLNVASLGRKGLGSSGDTAE